jgi:acetoin utilization protein AcuB
MRKRALRHLPVVDPRGRLVGIITDRDLRQVVFMPALRNRVREIGERLQTLTVSDIMTRTVVVVKPGARISEAARLMHDRKIGALPVVERGQVVGIITETDILAAFEEAFAAKGVAIHALPQLGRTLVRPLRRQPVQPDRYEYGFPVPDIHDPWQDQGGGH